MVKKLSIVAFIGLLFSGLPSRADYYNANLFNVSALPNMTVEQLNQALDNGLVDMSQQFPDGSNLFLVAAATAPYPLVESLINRGANVYSADRFGNNVLITAALYNPDPEIIKLLLRHGSLIDSENNTGGTALLYASRNNPNPEVIKTLIEAGANVNHTDQNNVFPLVAAATTPLSADERDTTLVIKYLLEAGANPHQYYNTARALDYAEQNPALQSSPTIQLLKDAMFNWKD